MRKFMMFGPLAPGIAASLALAACGSTGPATSTGENAQTLAAETLTAAPVTAPADLPAFATVYPGGRLTMAVTQADGKGLIGYDAPANAAEIIDFYKGRGISAGLVTMAETSTAGGQLLTMRRSGSQTAALQVTVTAKAGSDVQVALLYDKG